MSLCQSTEGIYMLSSFVLKAKSKFSVRLIVCLAFPKSLACRPLFPRARHSASVGVINLTRVGVGTDSALLIRFWVVAKLLQNKETNVCVCLLFQSYMHVSKLEHRYNKRPLLDMKY